MLYLNDVKLIGYLGRDPQVLEKGASFALAVTEIRKDKEGNKLEKTDWFRVFAWGKLGEIVTKYLKKGAQVLVCGNLKTGRYKDKEGIDRYTVDVFASDVQIIKWPTDKSKETEPAEGAADLAKSAAGNAVPATAENPDEIPF